MEWGREHFVTTVGGGPFTDYQDKRPAVRFLPVAYDGTFKLKSLGTEHDDIVPVYRWHDLPVMILARSNLRGLLQNCACTG